MQVVTGGMKTCHMEFSSGSCCSAGALMQRACISARAEKNVNVFMLHDRTELRIKVFIVHLVSLNLKMCCLTTYK